jgi:hypothetical protein
MALLHRDHVSLVARHSTQLGPEARLFQMADRFPAAETRVGAGCLVTSNTISLTHWHFMLSDRGDF